MSSLSRSILNRFSQMKVLLIDPQSDDNLGLYDYHLMTNLEGNIIFCGSVTYNGPKIVSKNIRTELVFSYLLEKKTLKKAFSYVRSIFKVARLIKKNGRISFIFNGGRYGL